MGKMSVRVPSWKDKFPLAVTIYTPTASQYDSEKVVVLINPALGVAQNSWLTKKNITAVTYDYRFAGDSLPADIQFPASAEARLQAIKSPEAAKVTLTDHWGRRDQPAVVEYVLERYKGYKLVILGHSLGGHIMALLPDKLRSEIFRAVFVGVNNPNWQNAPKDFVPTFLDMWTKTLTCIKNEGFLRREDNMFQIVLPAGTALEWVNGMLSDDKKYLAGTPGLESRYTSWDPKNEIISLAFQDDATLMSQNPPIPIDEWCQVFPKAKITRVLVSPDQVGAKEIGHTGMFREGNERVWEMIRDILIDGKIPDQGSIRRWNQGKARL